MAKKIGDLLAFGLLLIAIWIVLLINNWLPVLQPWIGNIGAGVLIASQGYFLLKKWFGNG